MQKQRVPLWALLWLALVLLTIAVFLGNTAAVDRLLDGVGLTPLLYPQGKSGTVAVVHPTVKPEPAEILLEPALTPSPQPSLSPRAEPSPTSDEPVPLGPNVYQLYFMTLGPDGRMTPTPFQRELPAGMTPLTATIKALLQGPSLQETSQGALSLIPEGTKLLSVRLKNKTAILSFSEEFQRNTMGLEGLTGQIRQIVWTATQFPSVDTVQFLVNGQYQDTLGEEGLSIGSPLSRSGLSAR